ncbi:glycerol-3-phosphate acyltransferase [Paratractidigestivibacter sp.]|uniref:glycerol-3-phosphate acyltransferase n=1 Tax=Paratractidigestivibacter sp. TaxID=2847316 RepID=UPI002ABE8F8B|nr:glycerol-3-phosphate acyltransferase [Paratractidigestivibacter sp.]
MGGSLNIVTLVAWTAVFVVFSYAVCGIPFGLVVAKAMGNIDVRSTGSGNIGTTNVARSVGKGAAALTLLLDLGKGLVCMLFSRFMISLLVLGEAGFSGSLATGEGLVAMTVIFLACVMGHIFSPYLHFRGGKGIAVGFGAALGLWWPIGLGLLVVFTVFAVPSRYVSLGSIAAACSLPIQCALRGFPVEGVLVVAVAAIVVVWSHRSNIEKLVRGEERKFTFHKKEDEGALKPVPETNETHVCEDDSEPAHELSDGSQDPEAPEDMTDSASEVDLTVDTEISRPRGAHFAAEPPNETEVNDTVKAADDSVDGDDE